MTHPLNERTKVIADLLNAAGNRFETEYGCVYNPDEYDEDIIRLTGRARHGDTFPIQPRATAILPHAEPHRPERVARTDWWLVKQWPKIAWPGEPVIVELPDRYAAGWVYASASLKWWIVKALP